MLQELKIQIYDIIFFWGGGVKYATKASAASSGECLCFSFETNSSDLLIL